MTVFSTVIPWWCLSNLVGAGASSLSPPKQKTKLFLLVCYNSLSDISVVVYSLLRMNVILFLFLDTSARIDWMKLNYTSVWHFSAYFRKFLSIYVHLCEIMEWVACYNYTSYFFIILENKIHFLFSFRKFSLRIFFEKIRISISFSIAPFKIFLLYFLSFFSSFFAAPT